MHIKTKPEGDIIRKMEYLDIVDERGNPTGETISREEAHKFGTLVRVEEQLKSIVPTDDNHSFFSAEEMTDMFDAKYKMNQQIQFLSNYTMLELSAFIMRRYSMTACSKTMK